MSDETHSTLEVSKPPPRRYEARDPVVGPDAVEPHEKDALVARRRQKSRSRGWLVTSALGALIGAVVVGAAVGGSVGSSLSSCKNSLRYTSGSDPQATPTTTITGTTASATVTTASSDQVVNFVPEPTGLVYSLNNTCAQLSNTPQQTLLGDKFNLYCGVDLLSGEDTVQTANGQALILADIVGIVAYSMADCLEACSVYTHKATQWGRSEICRSVTLDYNMASAIGSVGGNCWLKNGTIAAPSQASGCQDCASAMLVAS